LSDVSTKNQNVAMRRVGKGVHPVRYEKGYNTVEKRQAEIN